MAVEESPDGKVVGLKLSPETHSRVASLRNTLEARSKKAILLRALELGLTELEFISKRPKQ
jgi:hypothetical protein